MKRAMVDEMLLWKRMEEDLEKTIQGMEDGLFINRALIEYVKAMISKIEEIKIIEDVEKKD